MSARIDLTGQRFGRLTAIAVVGKNQARSCRWECVCDCGNSLIVNSLNLRMGNSRSCGCLRKESTGKRFTKHGKNKTPEHRAWLNMKSYRKPGEGARKSRVQGIKVCDRWLESFENFYEDMGDRPSSVHSIHRIDPSGDYCLENCEWATKKERTSNVAHLSLNGTIKTITEWATFLGISRRTIYDRKQKGWSDEEILTTPARSKSRSKQPS